MRVVERNGFVAAIEDQGWTKEVKFPLGAAEHMVMPDRIEMGTIACAAAITNGEVLLENGRLDLLGGLA